ncbi:carbohydrate ABC transporter permease [Oceanobacillus polygoni]|uniref:Multiple sugar transport system permease protein n=1 Tax=Oceanobacillus polygoni TaxID=1235259 RepID=A0A9X0YND6_9BACI|nr:carbohydrate ABC transporter permease [Oceanobacillus polygoni]MBP2075975.1 multiple sugar transport system permease protein [Oceanobacillus polygoni]
MSKRGRVATYLSIIVLGSIALVPILWMISVMFRSNPDVFAVPLSLLPPEFTWEAFAKVFSNQDLMRLFLNSYIIAIAVTFICVLFAALAGYGFSRFEFKGKRTALIYILLTQMFPMVLLVIPYFLFVSRVGLYDTYWALILAYTSFALPFSIMMLRDFINTIPRELDEAAKMDGCGPFRTFFFIILPPSLPGLISTAVYTFILAWNEFLFAVMLTNSIASRPLTIGIGMLIGEFTTEWNALMALSFMASAPLIIVFLFVQKFFLQGLTAGSVK